MPATPEIPFREAPLAALFSDTKWVAEVILLCNIFNLTTLICHCRGEPQLCAVYKVAALKAKVEYGSAE